MNPTRVPGMPVELRLDARRVVLVGAGAARRVDALLESGARVDADAADLSGAFLVMHTVTPTGPVSLEDAEALRARCRASGAWLWVEDRPDLSDITLPALLEIGPVRLAVSTGGRSSALARAVRDALRPLLGAPFAAWAEDALSRRLGRPRGRFSGRFEALPPEDE